MNYAIGIDLGGTFVKYALISLQGSFALEGKLPTHADESAQAVIQQIITAVNHCVKHAAQQHLPLVGIGIGTPGITDRSNRIVLGGADNIVGWSHIPLADILEQRFALPTLLANDANLMGLGEQTYGAAQGCSDVLFITVGTGIGGAIIINNQLYGGYDNRGTELGHLPFVMDGEPCSCGSVGCWEAYASTTAMVHRFATRAAAQGITLEEEASGKLITRLYHQRHPLAMEAIDEECRFLGRGIASLVNIFSPQKVVIGGGISEAGDFFITKVSEYTQRYAMPDCAANTTLCAATLGNKAGAMGAAQLLFHSLQH